MSILTIILAITTYLAYRDMHQFFIRLCLLLIAIDICTAIFAVQTAYEVKYHDKDMNVPFRIGEGFTLIFFFGG